MLIKKSLYIKTILLLISVFLLQFSFIFAKTHAWNITATRVTDIFEGYEENPQIISDGSGGSIVVWEDYRNGSWRDIYAQKLDSFGNALWGENGTKVSALALDQRYPELVSDDAGGAIIVWENIVSLNVDNDIYAQRVDSTGNPLWTTNGIRIATESLQQMNPSIIPDNSGGAFITWQDERTGNNLYDIYAQRLDENGNALWDDNGSIVCDATEMQVIPQIASDGANGAFITWVDTRPGGSNRDIYAQLINSSGDPQWTLNGIGICTQGSDQTFVRIISDNAGNATILWEDSRTTGDIYAQRVNTTGIVQWAANGAPIVQTSAGKSYAELTNDGNGGAIIAWAQGNPNQRDIYAQHINSSGDLQWDSNGIEICTEEEDQRNTQITHDGVGGAIIVWQDNRRGWQEEDIYAQRIEPDGTTLWGGNGTAIDPLVNGNQLNPQLSFAEVGAVIVTWQDSRTGNTEVYSQYILDIENPNSNSPGPAIYEPNSTETIPWILIDNFAGGFYRVLKNGSEYLSWTPWTSGSNLNIPINTSILGVWNYTIYYNDTLGFWGIPNTVLISIVDTQNPSSNSPGPAIYEPDSTASIPWILTDNFAGGYFRVLKNGSDYISWTSWTNGLNLNITIDTSILGDWNYTVYYYDSSGNWGTPNTVLISITEEDLTSSVIEIKTVFGVPQFPLES